MIALPSAPLLFGRDATAGIVAVELEPDGRSVRVYRREGDDLRVEIEPFAPWALVGDRALLDDAPSVTGVTRLAGGGALAWLARFRAWSDALAARDRWRARHPGGAASAPFLFPADAVHQYLLQSGRTFFKDLRFGDLRRMALDIEVLTTEGFDFPTAERDGDRIIAVALADSSGFRHVVRGDRLSERELLEECVRLVRERDPDVLEGHNIFRFDLEYLEARARRHDVRLAWGRDGSALRGYPARLQIAERTIGYRRYQVAGRHIVDTWMLAQLHDAGTRDLPSFGLKDLARHFGVAAGERTYLDPAAIPRVFRDDPERLMAYAIDDAVETLGIARVLAPPYFAQAQMLPYDFQSTTLRGAAAKIDALLLREHLARGHAVPMPGPARPVGGGHTAIFHQGVARPALHVDVTSLYPSLMLALDIAPAADDLGVFRELLGHLREFRVSAKRLAREARDEAERLHFHALQQSFKILINAFYGYLAFGDAHWNDFTAADQVTTEGRRVVGTILDRLRELGATPIEVDTDGVYFLPADDHGADDDDALVERLMADLPPGINLELDGRYAAMLSYKMKTYALLDGRGRLTLRGSGFRSRGLEPFARALIREIVQLLVLGRPKDVKAVIDRWLADFAAHRVPLQAFARTETLQDSLDTYRERVQAGARNPSACYEVAAASGRAFIPGDQVSYYVSGRGARVAVSECARLADLWDAAAPDENVEFYQSKVVEIAERFRPFLDYEGLRPYIEDVPEDPQLSLF
ncbi:MAG TPA: DNA polymerase domain-containing protein [Methylomirabilota bacterium]